MVEEMWPRYGSFPGFNPIVELSLTFHNLVVGANGQRQAMFLENVPGLAARILRNFDLSQRRLGADHQLQRLQRRADRNGRAVSKANDVRIVSIISPGHSNKSQSNSSCRQEASGRF